MHAAVAETMQMGRGGGKGAGGGEGGKVDGLVVRKGDGAPEGVMGVIRSLGMLRRAVEEVAARENRG